MAMKMFNWLNRKLHSNVDYCHIYKNKTIEEKEEMVRRSLAEQDTEALLLRDVLLNGILAIGTLGHQVHSILPETCSDEEGFFIVEKESGEQDDGEEKNSEVGNTMAIAASAPALVLEPIKMHSLSTKEEKLASVVMEELVARHQEEEDVAKIQERPLLMEEKIEKARTTLADLFAAEVLVSSNPEKQTCQATSIAATSPPKAALCMDKMQQKKPEKSTPTRVKATTKLRRAMRKMLGKKIHPEQLNGRDNGEGRPLTG